MGFLHAVFGGVARQDWHSRIYCLRFAGPPEHGAGGCPEECIQQRPVVIEKGPQDMRHGKRDVLPVAVGEDMRLLCNPLLCGFKSATAAGF